MFFFEISIQVREMSFLGIKPTDRPAPAECSLAYQLFKVIGSPNSCRAFSRVV